MLNYVISAENKHTGVVKTVKGFTAVMGGAISTPELVIVRTHNNKKTPRLNLKESRELARLFNKFERGAWHYSCRKVIK